MVDFAHWWSFIGKGLLLQPVQQACFIIGRLKNLYILLIHIKNHENLKKKSPKQNKKVKSHLWLDHKSPVHPFQNPGGPLRLTYTAGAGAEHIWRQRFEISSLLDDLCHKHSGQVLLFGLVQSQTVTRAAPVSWLLWEPSKLGSSFIKN